MRAGLEKREANVSSALTQAKQDAAAARAELETAKKELAAAAVEARKIVEEARKDAEELKAAKTEEGIKEAQAERERAKREYALRMDQQRKDIQQEVIALALLIASKALRREVSFANQQQLLEESIAELNQNASQQNA
jgi:F-type H+-transporting ATPase subunit b